MNVVGPLLIGAFIYIMLVPTAWVSKLIYSFVGTNLNLEITVSPGSFITCYMADCLWAYALFFLLGAIQIEQIKDLIVVFCECFLFEIIVEIMQLVGVFSGTFDSTAINNQKVLYQLHLKQISSSFSYLSNYMDYLAGNSSKPDSESYFKELPDMPTPDTVMEEIVYDSEKTDSGVKQYMYLIGDTEEDANMNYNAYIVSLGVCDNLSVDITSNIVYVTKNGTMVSAMMAGTDPVKGRFMIVSFQE